MKFNNSGRLRKYEGDSFTSGESVVRKLKPTFNPKLRMSSELKTDRDTRSIHSGGGAESVQDIQLVH